MLQKLFLIFVVAGMLFSPTIFAQTISDLQARIDSLFAEVAKLQKQLESKPCDFTRNLTVGMVGDDIKCLQQYLNAYPATQVAAMGAGSLGNETSYFGSLTRVAVAKWQAANGIFPVVGYFGPISRAKYSSLVAIVSLPPEPEQLVASAIAEQIVAPPAPSEEPSIEPPVKQPIVAACRTRKVPSEYAAIQEAVNAACEGDTILIVAGTYRENIAVKTEKLTIKGEEGGVGKTIIAPDAGPGITSSNGVSEITVRDLTFRGAFANTAILLNAPPGKTVSFTIQNNVIKNFGIGIAVTAVSGKIIIRKNLLEANKDFGIYDNVSSLATLTVENNTIIKGDIGYYLASPNGSHKLTNNIIANFEKTGVEVGALATDEEHKILTISYNDLWNSRAGSRNYFSNRRNVSFTPNGVGNFSTDPFFAAPDDYHLRAGSLLINAGDSSSPQDADGTRADIGAYSFDLSVVAE